MSRIDGNLKLTIFRIRYSMALAMSLTKTVIGEKVQIGSNCTIGICSIGNHAVIGDLVVIEDGVFIGSHVHIESGCILEKDSRIGNHVWIQSGSIVKKKIKIPSKTKIASRSIVE